MQPLRFQPFRRVDPCGLYSRLHRGTVRYENLDGLRDNVLVACPDARSPAYQAVVGLACADGFVVSSRRSLFPDAGSPKSPDGSHRSDSAVSIGLLRRRHEPEIPAQRVRSDWGLDLALAAEKRRLAKNQPEARLRQFAALADTDDSTGLSNNP